MLINHLKQVYWSSKNQEPADVTTVSKWAQILVLVKIYMGGHCPIFGIRIQIPTCNWYGNMRIWKNMFNERLSLKQHEIWENFLTGVCLVLAKQKMKWLKLTKVSKLIRILRILISKNWKSKWKSQKRLAGIQQQIHTDQGR